MKEENESNNYAKEIENINEKREVYHISLLLHPFIICNIIIPLTVGAYIYVYYDDSSYFGDFVRYYLNITHHKLDSAIMLAIRNWGCDFLFAYALLFALYANTKIISISIRYAFMCSVGLELLQLIQIDFLRCGTFDILDIIVEITAICFAATFISCHNHNKNTKGGNTDGQQK